MADLEGCQTLLNMLIPVGTVSICLNIVSILIMSINMNFTLAVLQAFLLGTPIVLNVKTIRGARDYVVPKKMGNLLYHPKYGIINEGSNKSEILIVLWGAVRIYEVYEGNCLPVPFFVKQCCSEVKAWSDALRLSEAEVKKIVSKIKEDYAKSPLKNEKKEISDYTLPERIFKQVAGISEEKKESVKSV